MKTFRRLICLFFIGFFSADSFSQEPSVQLQPTKILIGDHLELTLKAQGSSTIFPSITDSSIGHFRFVEELKADTLYSGNTSTISKKYIITCFEDSIQTLPPLRFYSSIGGSLYLSKPISIQVSSPNIDSAKDVKPIKTILLIPLSKKEIISYLFISLLLFGLIVLVYFIYIKYIRKELLLDVEKPLDPPHVTALLALKDIENKELWQRNLIKEYYDQVSDTIRWYLEKRFGIKALEQTTIQTHNDLAKLNLPEELHRFITEILQLADLAKFAKESPNKTANLAILKKSYDFIQKTQLSYDANKKANALQVRKFYAQNSYGYKTAAINQSSFKLLIYGLLTTMAILSLTIAVAYLLPIEPLLIKISDTPLLFFSIIMSIGVFITLVALIIYRNRMKKFKLIFDYNSIITLSSNRHTNILFSQLFLLSELKNKDILLTEKSGRSHTLSRKLEYFEEIKERIADILDLEQNSNEQQ